MTLSTERQAVVDELRTTVKSVCHSLGGPECARRALDAGNPGVDPAAWDILAGQLGIAALGLPEAVDGVGGLPELLAVSEELGAALLPVPFFGSTVLAGQTLTECGSPAYPALQSMAAGEIFAVATRKEHQPSRLQLGHDGRVTGIETTVLNGVQAHWLIAETPDAVVLIDLRDPACHVTPSATLDLTRSFASVAVENATCTILRDASSDAPCAARARAALALAAEQVGGARACLEMTVTYVKERHQFSRPIGSFQAIKHTVADALVKVELARSALIRALEISESDGDLTEAAAVARIWCSDAYRFITAETIQLHGGIGFTWEHNAHLYFRRARSDALLLGTTSDWRDTLAAALSW